MPTATRNSTRRGTSPPLPLALVTGAGPWRLVELAPQLGDDLGDCTVVQTLLLEVHPALQLPRALRMDALACRPELLDDVHDIDGVDGLGEVALGVTVQVEISVGDDLDQPSGLRRKATLVRLAAGDLEGMLLWREGSVEPAVG